MVIEGSSLSRMLIGCALHVAKYSSTRSPWCEMNSCHGSSGFGQLGTPGRDALVVALMSRLGLSEPSTLLERHNRRGDGECSIMDTVRLERWRPSGRLRPRGTVLSFSHPALAACEGS